MKFLFFALPLLAAAWSGHMCLSDDDADSIVQRSIVFLEHSDIAAANASAQSLFADDIQEYGDSINALRGDPLGTRVENGKATYIAETLSTPPIPNIVTLDIVHDCSTVAWYWIFEGIGSGEYRVQGSTLIKLNSEGLINYQLVIFNSLSWGLDLGFQVIPAALPGSRKI